MQPVPAVVLNHNLLNGHSRMTLVTFRNGRVVMPDLRGKVGTGQSCCECTMPSAVTFTLSGSPKIFFYGTEDGNTIADDTTIFDDCDIVPEYFAAVWNGPEFPGTGRLLQPDCEVVLDLVEASCGYWRYEGLMPEGPHITDDYPEVTCGGDLNQLVSVIIQAGSSPITVTFSPPTGEGTRAAGAVLTSGGGVQSIEITDPGSGYATAVLVHVEPVILLSVASSGGSGAVLEATLQSYTDQDGGLLWRVLSVSVEDGGSGYQSGDTVSVSCSGAGDCYEWLPASFTVTVASGAVSSVAVDDGGGYYGEDFGESEVDSVAVLIGSRLGAGATATASVDADPNSETFGQILSVSVTNAGSGYVDQARYLISIQMPDVSIYEEVFWAVFQHTEVLIGDEQDADYPADPDNLNNPAQCFIDQLSSIAPRLSYKTCPVDLLNKTYDMKVFCRDGFFWEPGTPFSLPPDSCDIYITGDQGGSFYVIPGPTITLST